MGIETGSFIDDLNQSWPTGSDPVQQGANHLRLIKQVLKSTFPGSDGLGYKETILAVEAELNALAGINTATTIQQQLNAISSAAIFPVGTKMIFYQAAPPPGWTYETTNNDSMLRCTSAFGGVAGGTQSPVNWTWQHAHTTADHTLTIAEIPSHSHNVSAAVVTGADLDGGGARNEVTSQSITTTSIGGGLPHNHGVTSLVTTTFTPRYINVIKGVKA
jgi:hypothetical protein